MCEYTVKIDEDVLLLVKKAIDFYIKIQLGGLNELSNPSNILLPEADYTAVDTSIKDLKAKMFPALKIDEYYSLRSKNVTDNIKQLVDVSEALKHLFETNFKPYHWSSEKQPPVFIKN